MSESYQVGLGDVHTAACLVEAHASAVIERRRSQGLPTCGDGVSHLAKLSGLMEEVGEVARCVQDDDDGLALRHELLDVATAAMLWAWAEGQA